MRLAEVLGGKPVSVITLPPTASVIQAAALMRAEGVGAVIVCDDRRRILGVLSERDLALAVAALGQGRFDLHLGEAAAAGASPRRPAAASATKRPVRRTPVIEDGVVVGMVSRGGSLALQGVETVRDNAAVGIWRELVSRLRRRLAAGRRTKPNG